MILTLISVGTICALGALLIKFAHKHTTKCSVEHKHEVMKTASETHLVQECEQECPCRHHTPHYHWVDHHRNDLIGYPDGFIALHPLNGVVVFDPDIREFATKITNTNHEQRAALMVLHTSMLMQDFIKKK
jgi:hypothetical protein